MPQRTPGVYVITCIPNGRRYVGSSSFVQSRWRQHRWALRHGKHCRPFMQADWDLYGETAFEFKLITVSADQDERYEIEQAHINAARAVGLAYNSAPRADGNTGMVHTAETRAKVGAASRALPRTAEHRRKIGDAHRGVPKSEGQRQKTSLRKRGEGNQNAKLTDDGVREIRRRLATGEIARTIAADFGVDISVVGKIKQGRRWRHVV